MNKAKDVFNGLLVGLFGIVIHPVAAAGFGYLAFTSSIWYLPGVLPFAIGLVACLMTKWYGTDQNGYLRGKLPWWAYIWSTPDEDAPGDIRGEPWVKNVYRWCGPTVACIYWHLERNRGMGLSYLCSRILTDGVYLDGKKWGYQELPSGAWRWVGRLGSFASIGFGTQTTMVNGVMWCRPWLSAKLQHDGNP